MRTLILKRFLQKFFFILYHQLAWAYDLVAWLVSLGRWNTWIKTALKNLDLKSGDLVLELGFGPGHLQLEMSVRGIVCFGIDESMQMCRIARRRLARTAMRLARGRAEKLPFTDGVVDFVITTFPAEYIFEQSTLMECQRVLRKNGTLLILMGVQPGGISVIDRLLRFLYRVTDQDFQFRLGAADFIDRIRAAGFDAEATVVVLNKDKLWMLRGHKV